MSVAQASTPNASAVRPAWSTANRIGLIIAFLYQVVNVLDIFLPSSGPGQPGPPVEILIAGAVLASVGLVMFALAWFTRRRLFARLGVAISVIVTLSAFPAFFVPEIPAAIRVLAAASTVIALVSSILVLLPSRTSSSRPSRGDR